MQTSQLSLDSLTNGKCFQCLHFNFCIQNQEAGDLVEHEPSLVLGFINFTHSFVELKIRPVTKSKVWLSAWLGWVGWWALPDLHRCSVLVQETTRRQVPARRMSGTLEPKAAVQQQYQFAAAHGVPLDCTCRSELCSKPGLFCHSAASCALHSFGDLWVTQWIMGWRRDPGAGLQTWQKGKQRVQLCMKMGGQTSEG